MAMQGIGNEAALVGATVTDGTTHASNIGAYGKWDYNLEEGVGYLNHGEFDPSDTNAIWVSPGIKGTWVNGQKIIIGVDITTAEGSGTSDTDLKIQGSVDGKTWTDISEVSTDLNPETVAMSLFTVDLSSYTLPWYRLNMNDQEQDLDAVKFNFIVSGLNSDYEEGLGISSSNVNNSLIGGVGVDPS